MAAISSTAYFSSQPQLPAYTANHSSSDRQPRRRPSSSFVTLEAAAASGGGAVGRTRSLTEEDLEELKGCLDLGFGFTYHEIPDLCGTLPALELCYSMTQRFLDERRAPGQEPAAVPLPDWRISGPGRMRVCLQCPVRCVPPLARMLNFVEITLRFNLLNFVVELMNHGMLLLQKYDGF